MPVQTQNLVMTDGNIVVQASEREENYEEQIRDLTARLNEVRSF